MYGQVAAVGARGAGRLHSAQTQSQGLTTLELLLITGSALAVFIGLSYVFVAPRMFL